MNTNITFLNIVAEYCNTPADEITNDMRFIEDLGFSSLDFMTFLGDLEDTFDVEVDEDEIVDIHTIGDAIKYLDSLTTHVTSV